MKSVLYVLVLKNTLNFNIESIAGSSTISSSADQPTVSAAIKRINNINNLRKYINMPN